MTVFPKHAAWDFALRVYSAPGVAPACLGLQERHGVDVTLMLFCLWRGSVSSRPLGEHFPALLASAREWHRSTVLPIRAARRRLKSGAERLEASEAGALYRVALAAELKCEHAEFLLLARQAEALCGPPDKRGGPFPATIARNLADFLTECGVSPSGSDQEALGLILAVADAEGEEQVLSS